MTDNKKEIKEKSANEVWFCREFWSGDSRDGQYLNGEGYHYFEMQGKGTILKAFEYYETEDGDEKVTPVPELIGINWFDFFGFEDDELLEKVTQPTFHIIEEMAKPKS